MSRVVPGRRMGAPLVAGLLAALLAGCTSEPSGLVSGWARVSGVVVRDADGTPVAGVTPSFAVFRDTACSDPVLTTVNPMPVPVTDLAGRYETDLRVFAWGVFRGCLAVTVDGLAVHVPADFGPRQERAPAVQVDLRVP